MTDRASKKQLITAKRKDQILNAALEIFSQKGFQAATIPEIAKSADLAAGTIYIYYPSKRDLFIAVIERLISEPLLPMLQQTTQTDLPAILKKLLINRLKFMDRIAPLMGEIQRDNELRMIFFNRLLMPLLTKMDAFYQSQYAEKRLGNLEPTLIVRTIASMMIGLSILRSLEGESSPLNKLPQEQVVENLVNFMLYGITGTGQKEKK